MSMTDAYGFNPEEQHRRLEERVAALEQNMDALVRVSTEQVKMTGEVVSMFRDAGRAILAYLTPAKPTRPEEKRKPS